MISRLEKKCVIASAGFHLLLALILLVGPAFLLSRTTSAERETAGTQTAQPCVLVVFPEKAIPVHEDPENRNQSREPTLTPASVAQPSLAPIGTGRTSKVRINTNLVTRPYDHQRDGTQVKSAPVLADGGALMAIFDQTLRQIGSGPCPATQLPELGKGVVGSDFLQKVKSIYEEAWLIPDSITDGDAAALVSVTIARDGRVLSSRIVSPSGARDVDESVQKTLARVKYAAPLPEDTKEDQRTVEINFNVRGKHT